MSDTGSPPTASPANAEATDNYPTKWGFWATFAWTVGAIALGNFLVGVVFHAWRSASPPGSFVENIDIDPVNVSAALILQLALLIPAARIVSASALEYFAIQWPTMRNLLLGVLCILLYIVFIQALTITISGGVLSFEFADLYKSAKNSNTLLLLWICMTIIPPIGEEMTFRGFVFRGWAESIGPSKAILLTSFAWMLTHLPGNIFFLLGIFLLGLLLGWLRWRSGSALLTIFLHALVNLVVMIELAVTASA